MVVKVVCTVEPQGPPWMLQPEASDLNPPEEISDEIRWEAQVYDRLRSLQGDVIPRLLFAGAMRPAAWDALATSYEGVSLEKDEQGVDEAFVEAALAALRKVHALGVLHQDLELRNVVRRPGTGEPVLIDFGQAIVVKATRYPGSSEIHPSDAR